MSKPLKIIVSLVGAFIVLVVIIAVAAGGGGSKSVKTSPPVQSATSSASQTPKSQADAGTQLPIQNGDWKLISATVKDDGLGDLGGHSRVTYTGSDTGASNVFELTVFKNGKDIGVLTGSADGVQPGQTVTVTWISSDSYVGGPYTYGFQNDF